MIHQGYCYFAFSFSVVSSYVSLQLHPSYVKFSVHQRWRLRSALYESPRYLSGSIKKDVNSQAM